MKRIVLIALITLTAGWGYSQNGQKDWANYAKYAEANESAPRGANAVFMGNSITEGWVRADPAFFSENNYIGRGISGQVTSQMLARFRRDVIELQPKSVVILAGTNDIAQNNGFITLENIMGNIASMCDIATAHEIKVIICSVLPVYEYKWRPGVEPAGMIIELNGMLKDYASMKGFAYVDYHSIMKDGRNGLPEKYAADGVHPNLQAYKLMESLVKPVIDRSIK